MYLRFILRYCWYLIVSAKNGSINDDRQLLKYFKASDRGEIKVLTWNQPEQTEENEENSLSGESLPWLRNYQGTCENRGHKSDMTAWYNFFGVYVVNNNNNNNNSDILTSSNISNEYSNIQNTKYARENTVIYLFIYFWFIKLHGSNDRTVNG